ncbi:Inosine-uridine preferring nucleoside hydrolase [Sporobacter termitidis DSM 10068]|uniref:Inosine-uridine preferring nucleoside hydrolase n=1 Tax=Sporobacter termitidis DSM 10068 TaxID=1123282 RepID=A0A1M5USI6_9FIRM|nr:nucleoside hydrolase [Sporobacter termitidis]SHH65673.1 Inosine-uridine preferring nucleoside hydrolase [Sporobacter termitidis DSM 10068]
MAKKVIYDCDNTMGVFDCDVDDGLALIYLLGKERIELCGITTTYGNSDIDTVYKNTDLMLRELGRTDIPLLRGCPGKGHLQSEAAEYLVQTAKAHKGDISILATGSLTNLYSACQLDRDFFDYTAEIVLMGGITEELTINGRILDELNFSCDPAAADCVLRSGKASSITGNNCLKAYFTVNEFRQRLEGNSRPIARYIFDKCFYWFENMTRRFNIDGFYNWDVVAAAYLAEPGLFKDNPQYLTSGPQQLKSGILNFGGKEARRAIVNLPEIDDPVLFAEDVYKSWLEVKIR